MSLKKRPELVQLPTLPTILKISEVPLGTYVMKRNLPFDLTHLAKAGVKTAYVVAGTSRTISSLLGQEVSEIRELKDTLQKQVREKYPIFGKHINLSLNAQLRFGNVAYGERQTNPHYIGDVPKLVDTLEVAGFPKLPLFLFQIPVENPHTWITFVRKKEVSGFVASQIGNKLYGEVSLSALEDLLHLNPILQSLKVHICEMVTATGKFGVCRTFGMQKMEEDKIL